MPSSRSSSASSASSSDVMKSLQQQCAEMGTKLNGVDTMSWVLLAVVTFYIAMVNPSNTPAFFSNTVFKFVLFAFVAIVFVLEGPLVGTMLGIAMMLPVVYSSLREGYQNPFIERYADEDDEEDKKVKKADGEDEDIEDVEADEDMEGVEDVEGAEGVEDEEDAEIAMQVDEKRSTDSPDTDPTAKLQKMLDDASPSAEPTGAEPKTETWRNFASVF